MANLDFTDAHTLLTTRTSGSAQEIRPSCYSDALLGMPRSLLVQDDMYEPMDDCYRYTERNRNRPFEHAE